MLTKKLRVFVSSTFEDLRDHRAKVIADLERAQIEVSKMETFEATRTEPTKVSEAKVRDCDVFVLLVSFRRGYVPTGDRYSITQHEYFCALENQLEIFVYVLDDDADWPADYDRRVDPEFVKWRNELSQKHTKGRPFQTDPSSINVLPDIAAYLQDLQWRAKRVGKQLSCIIPAKNEAPRIVESLKQIVEYLKPYAVELVVVDDCSDDDTFSIAQSLAASGRLGPDIAFTVLPNEHRDEHKMGAIRTGAEYASTSLVLLLDADTSLENRQPIGTLDGLEASALECLVDDMHRRQPIDDVSSFTVLPTKAKGILQRWQLAEYAIATRGLRNILHTTPCVSGAASVWRREKLLEALETHSGVFDGDDLELTLLAYQMGMRVRHNNSIVARTTPPRSALDWLKQRIRWDWGFLRLVLQGRFWTSVFCRPSQVGAVFRGITIADVLLHPVKLVAFLYPFLVYQSVSSDQLNVGTRASIPYLLTTLTSLFIAALLIGVASSLYVKNGGASGAHNGSVRLRYAVLWIVYMCSPFLAILGASVVRHYREADLQPVVVSGNLEIPAFQQFLVTAGPEIGLFLTWSMVWWLPLSTYLLHRSSDGLAKADKIGVLPLLLLPFYFLFQILVIRTATLVTWMFFWRQQAQRARCVALSVGFALICGLLLLPVSVWLTVRARSVIEPSDWFDTCVRKIEVAPGKRVAYLESYPTWPGVFWVYDTSLAVIHLSSRGDHENARLLLEGLRMIQEPDGIWNANYLSTSPGVISDYHRDTAANAFVAISAFSYQLRTGDTSYQEMAKRCMARLAEAPIEGRIEGWPGQAMPPELDDRWGWARSYSPSTKATIATYAACRFAEAATKGSSYSQLEASLRKFLVEYAWKEEPGFFQEFERFIDGKRKTPSVDVQAWGVLALGKKGPNGEDFSLALRWCERVLSEKVEIPLGGGYSSEVEGFLFSPDVSGVIYVEGTLQVAAAYFSIRDLQSGARWVKECRWVRSRNGGVFYAIGGTNVDYRKRPAVASTVWYRLNETPRLNPLSPPQETTVRSREE